MLIGIGGDVQVFDDYVVGPSTAYSTVEDAGRLAEADSLAFSLVVEDVDVGGTANVTIEHSGDGRHWQPKTSIPTLASPVFPGIRTTVVGYDVSGTPSLGFVRFSFFWTGSTTKGRVKISASFRYVARP